MTTQAYTAPTVSIQDVQVVNDRAVQWFVVLIVFLLTLAATLSAAVVIYCWNKGGSLYTWYRLSTLEVKVGYNIP